MDTRNSHWLQWCRSMCTHGAWPTHTHKQRNRPKEAAIHWHRLATKNPSSLSIKNSASNKIHSIQQKRIAQLFVRLNISQLPCMAFNYIQWQWRCLQNKSRLTMTSNTPENDAILLPLLLLLLAFFPDGHGIHQICRDNINENVGVCVCILW